MESRVAELARQLEIEAARGTGGGGISALEKVIDKKVIEFSHERGVRVPSGARAAAKAFKWGGRGADMALSVVPDLVHGDTHNAVKHAVSTGAGIAAGSAVGAGCEAGAIVGTAGLGTPVCVAADMATSTAVSFGVSKVYDPVVHAGGRAEARDLPGHTRCAPAAPSSPPRHKRSGAMISRHGSVHRAFHSAVERARAPIHAPCAHRGKAGARRARGGGSDPPAVRSARAARSGARLALALDMMFANRIDAGRQLADTLRAQTLVAPVVVGLSRGGVPVAAEVARRLAAPLEMCVVRKLLAPGIPQVAIGAIAEGGGRYVDEVLIAALGVATPELERAIAREEVEVARLSGLLRDRPAIEVAGRDTILVDDGLLTGGTVRAAARSLELRGARRIVLAVPVANSAALAAIRPVVDRVVCLVDDPILVAVGARFHEFEPVSEAEVASLLAAAPQRARGGRSREALRR